MDRPEPQKLLDYLTGAVEAPLAASGSAIRAAAERWTALRQGDEIDYEAEGLLERAEDRDGRADLLRQLLAAGVPIETLRTAVKQDRLALIPVEAVLQASGEHSLGQMSSESGLDEETLARRLSALGLGNPEPDTVFNDDSLTAARALKELEDAGLPDEGIDDICRIAGRGLGATAEGIREVVGDAYIEAGDSEQELGLRYAAAARRLLPVFAPLLEFTLTMHLLRLVRGDVVSRAERATGELPKGRDIAVCFADLSDFTELGEQVSAETLGGVVRRFEKLVQDCLESAEVRHVKTVGDAAMLISPEPDELVRTTVALVEAADSLAGGLPRIHAGVAYGPAVTKDGDWHGRAVNLASRLAASAPAGRVYASDDLCREADGSFEWTEVSPRAMKGIDDPSKIFCLSPAPS